MFNFILLEIWSGSQTNVWADKMLTNNQCFFLSWKIDKTLKDCKRACLQFDGCTAIHINNTEVTNNKNCQLYGCPQPVPVPTAFDSAWSGHYLLNGNHEL